MTAGKKECVGRGNDKLQKRLLLTSLKKKYVCEPSQRVEKLPFQLFEEISQRMWYGQNKVTGILLLTQQFSLKSCAFKENRRY